LSAPNAYDDAERARSYATLEFPGTYYLAFRDLPTIIGANVTGRVALDFGCGAGRSTRFLKALGFRAIGIDISASMIAMAQQADPGGTYVLVNDGDFSGLEAGSFDLVLCAFTFDNVPDAARRARLLRGLRDLLRRDGSIVLLNSTAEIYLHEWVSFTTQAFAENRLARSGDPVRIVMKDVADRRPIVDYLWFAEDYQRLFAASGLHLSALHRPLGRADEPYQWQSELSVAPWVIHVLRRDDR
jgi:SAM-dependent methyltransferase